ncbi:MAG: Rrf2 family transcriptional regulator [Flexilinea sp.]|nr:Rrf2 family transcriptional regulator [Flexilinea sp.]
MISTKGRYGLRVMIDLAENEGGKPVPLKDIAERQAISKKYLEIIVKELVNAGFVIGTSGKGGGYKLSRDPRNYTAGEILEVLEGTLAPVACLRCGAESCKRESFCKTLPMWKEYAQMTHDFFYKKSLMDLAES